MQSLWPTFWGEFLQQSLVNKISFILPFIGIPTVIGVISNWSTKARLRKLSEGLSAENQLLKEEILALQKRSFHHRARQAQQEGGAESLDLLDVFNRNKKDIVALAESLASNHIVDYWASGVHARLDDAIYFSKISLAINPSSTIGRIVFEASLQKSKFIDDEFIAQLAASPKENIDVFRNTVLILCEKVERFLLETRFADAITLSRFVFLGVCAQSELYSDIGYNALFCLAKSLLLSLNGKRPIRQKQQEIISVLDLWIDVVDRTFPDPDHATQFVSKFYYATALHVFEDSAAALHLLEAHKLPDRVGPCVGRGSSACFATRHLYANLLYEEHRSSEAEQVVSALKNDLSGMGQLSENHIRTYKGWASRAQSVEYRRGRKVRFPNTGNLVYR